MRGCAMTGKRAHDRVGGGHALRRRPQRRRAALDVARAAAAGVGLAGVGLAGVGLAGIALAGVGDPGLLAATVTPPSSQSRSWE
jgi:hypothetical protein